VEYGNVRCITLPRCSIRSNPVSGNVNGESSWYTILPARLSEACLIISGDAEPRIRKRPPDLFWSTNARMSGNREGIRCIFVDNDKPVGELARV